MTPRLAPAALLAAGLAGAAAAGGHEALEPLYRLGHGEELVEVERLALEFDVYQPRGLEKVGTRFFLSAVHYREYPALRPDGTHTPGKGRGHLLVFDVRGELQRHLRLGHGSRYVPGGVSSDGHRLWIPVSGGWSEGPTSVYTLDLESLRLRREFDADVHLGCLAADPSRRVLHAWGWDGRTRYTYSYGGRKLAQRPEPNGFVAYRDAKVMPDGNVLAGGPLAARARPAPGEPAAGEGPQEALVAGGLGISDLGGRLLASYPLRARSELGRVLSAGPMALEVGAGGPRLHFLPDEARGTIYTLAPGSAQVQVGLEPPPAPEPADTR